MPGEVSGKVEYSSPQGTPPSLKKEIEIMKKGNLKGFRYLNSTTFFSLKQLETSQSKQGIWFLLMILWYHFMSGFLNLKFHLILIDFGSKENLEPKENSKLYLTIDPSDNISTILVFND